MHRTGSLAGQGSARSASKPSGLCSSKFFAVRVWFSGFQKSYFPPTFAFPPNHHRFLRENSAFWVFSNAIFEITNFQNEISFVLGLLSVARHIRTAQRCISEDNFSLRQRPVEKCAAAVLLRLLVTSRWSRTVATHFSQASGAMKN